MKQVSTSSESVDFDFETTADIHVPPKLIDQIIGQDEAVQALKIAATQQRFLLLIGPPGTGKSMLARAYSELISPRDRRDLLAFPNPHDPFHPQVTSVPAGKGKATIEKLTAQQSRIHRFLYKYWIDVLIAIVSLLLLVFVGFDPYLFLLLGLMWIISKSLRLTFGDDPSHAIPALLFDAGSTSHFVDATGLEAGGLFGDVLHDPYQSGGLETPAHRRLVVGAVHKANGGVLYIDEAGNLDVETQIELLTVLQERKCPIRGRSKESASSTIQTDPLPANFTLIIAGNMETIELLHPALRSRIQGYGYEILMNTEMPDTPANRKKLVQFIAQEVKKDGKIPHFSRKAVELLIQIARDLSSTPNTFTLELRTFAGIIRAAGDLAKASNVPLVEPEHIEAAKNMSAPIDVKVSQRLISSLTFHPSTIYILPSLFFSTPMLGLQVFSYSSPHSLESRQLFSNVTLPSEVKEKLQFLLGLLGDSYPELSHSRFFIYLHRGFETPPQSLVLAIVTAIIFSLRSLTYPPLIVLGETLPNGKVIVPPLLERQIQNIPRTFPGQIIVPKDAPEISKIRQHLPTSVIHEIDTVFDLWNISPSQ